MSKHKPKILPPAPAASPAIAPSLSPSPSRPDYVRDELGDLRGERPQRPARVPVVAARPWIETRVSQPAGATSAIARPVYPRDAKPPEAPTRRRRGGGGETAAAPAPRLARERTLDLFARGIWSAAVALGVGLSWDDPEWRAGRFRPAALLDALARVATEEAFAFPLPGSPRLDGVGGGRRVAADGSPGVPEAWVRWIDRDAEVEHAAAHPHATTARRLARSPLMLAQLALARRDPQLWRVYAAAVLAGGGVSGASQRLGEPVAKIRRSLEQARAHLLASLALYGGEASDEEYEALVAALR